MANVLVRKRVYKSKTTYEYRYEIASVNGKRKWFSLGGFATKKEALEEGIKSYNTYIARGRIIEYHNISVSDMLDMWYEYNCKPFLKESTLNNYDKKLRIHIKPAIGHLYLNIVDKLTLQKILNDMYDKGYSRNTLSVIKGILTKSFNYAVDLDMIPFSPAGGLRLPKGEVTKIVTRSSPHSYIAEEKMNAIFQRFPEGSADHIPLMLGYKCGLRIGEAFAVTWNDIDFKKRTLTVNRQIQWRQSDRSKEEKNLTNGSKSNSAGSWYFSAPKYNSFRTVELDQSLIDLLQREKEKQQSAESYFGERYFRYYENEQRVISSDPEGKEIHFVSIRENGELITSRTMQHTSSVIHKQLKITEFDFHSLRHTHATMLIEHGAPLKYVQERLGHKSIDVTLNIYQHMTNTIRTQGEEILNKMFE